MINKLSKTKIHLWLFQNDETSKLSEVLDHFSSFEIRKKANRFHFHRDKIRSTHTHSALNLLLLFYSSGSIRHSDIIKNNFGKPLIKDSDICFNLSHAGDYALIGFTKNNPIGVDIELVKENHELISLAKRFFHKDEIDALTLIDSEKRTDYFYEIWTKKEAVIKAFGKGLSQDLNSFSVTSNDSVKIQTEQTRVPCEFFLQKIISPKGYKAACCLSSMPTKQILFGSREILKIAANLEIPKKQFTREIVSS